MANGTQTEPQELDKQATSLAVQAHQLVRIQDANQYRDAVNLGRALKAMEDGIDAFWSEKVQAAHRLHKQLVKDRDDMKSPVQIAIAKIKGVIAAYDQEQERIRRQKELEAQEALRKQQEAAAIAEAQALQASGDAEGAEAVISQAAASPAPAVVIPRSVPIVPGKSSKEVWGEYRVIDQSKIRPEYLIPDHAAIRSAITRLKKRAETAVGGIEVIEPKISVSFRK